MKRYFWGKKNFLLAVIAIILLVPKTQEGLTVLAAEALSGLSGLSWLRDLSALLPISPTHTDLFLKTLATTSPLSRFVSQAIVFTVASAVGATIIAKAGKEKFTLSACLGIIVFGQAFVNFFSLDLSAEALEDMGYNFVIGPLIEGRIDLYSRSLEVIPWVIRLAFIFLSLSPLTVSEYSPKIKVGAITLTLICAVFLAGFLQPKAANEAMKAQVQIAPSPEPVQPTETTIPTTERSSPTPFPTRVLGSEKPAIVRGVHYYFGNILEMPQVEREKIFRRDLAIINQVGFNAIAGWEEDGFDENFLKLAEEYRIWVIKPLNLPLKDGDFLNQEFRQGIKNHVAQKIKEQRNIPSLLMWNIGADEPLEQMSRHYKRPADQVAAAADLIVELSVMAHELDPNHMVIISEPQDWYVQHYQFPLERARKAGVDPNSFFIFGANFYAASTLRADLDRTRGEVSRKLNLPFAVMEYAPFGVDRIDRPLFRAKMAKEVSKTTPISVVYVFNPAVDPLNYMPDPTLAIVTGLSITDLERSDKNGLLTAVAGTLERPLFPVALEILKKDRESGYFGIPLSDPIPLADGNYAQYFSRREVGRKNITYKWAVKEESGKVIISSEIVE